MKAVGKSWNSNEKTVWAGPFPLQIKTLQVFRQDIFFLLYTFTKISYIEYLFCTTASMKITSKNDIVVRSMNTLILHTDYFGITIQTKANEIVAFVELTHLKCMEKNTKKTCATTTHSMYIMKSIMDESIRQYIVWYNSMNGLEWKWEPWKWIYKIVFYLYIFSIRIFEQQSFFHEIFTINSLTHILRCFFLRFSLSLRCCQAAKDEKKTV